MHLHMKKVAVTKKGCDLLSVLHKDQGVIHDICEKKIPQPHFMSQKTTVKNAYSPTFSNSQQKCVNGLK